MTRHKLNPRFSLIISTVLMLLLLPLISVAKDPLQVVNFTAKELQNLKGHYSTVYGYVYIHVSGRHVSTNIDGKYIELFKKSDGHFYPKYKVLKLIPIDIGDMSFSLKDNKGKHQIVMHKKDKRTKKINVKTVAQKFNPVVIPAFWKTKLGKYKATLIKGKSKIKDIRLAVRKGVLVAFINKYKSPYPLLALSASKLYSPSAGHNKGRQIHIASSANKITLNYGKNSLMLNKL
ncbi:MAG: hypothetical protein V3U71_08200 [Cocleimonas sp.]